jgi:threonine dehydratase
MAEAGLSVQEAATVTMNDIRVAAERLRPHATVTPLLYQRNLGRETGAELYLKAENLQRTGAFKFRGAYNIMSLLKDQGVNAVVTSSSGNHGQAVAAAGEILGISVTVVVPEEAVTAKVEAIRGYRGTVIYGGRTSLDREGKARELCETEGGTVIGSYDDARLIAGQGTCGLEITQQLTNVDIVVIPVGGGGLVSGVATAVKSLIPGVKVYGVEPAGAADAEESLRSGRIVTWPTIDTICDGLRTSRVGYTNFPIMQRLLDGIVTVTDRETLQAMRQLAFTSNLVVEPSGAVAVAAVLSGKLETAGKRVACVISGGNVDPTAFASILTQN